MKSPEQYFPVILFDRLYKVVLTFESVHDILKSLSLWYSYCTSSYEAVKGSSNSESVDKIQKSNHSK